jgi:hypothetical protein
MKDMLATILTEFGITTTLLRLNKYCSNETYFEIHLGNHLLYIEKDLN